MAPTGMLASYGTRLRTLICDHVRAVPPHSITEIEIDECPVLVIDVRRADKAPYATHDNDVYIRKGATNRKPDPKTELPRIGVMGPPFDPVPGNWSS